MSAHASQVRVRYAETDTMGVAYYENYFVWFEVGRSELLRSLGHIWRPRERRRDASGDRSALPVSRFGAIRR